MFLQDIKNRFVWQINLTFFRFLTSRRIDTRVMVLQTFALPLGHGVFCTMWCIFKPFLSIFALFPSKRNQLETSLETSLCSYYNKPLSFCEPLLREIRGLFAIGFWVFIFFALFSQWDFFVTLLLIYHPHKAVTTMTVLLMKTKQKTDIIVASVWITTPTKPLPCSGGTFVI